MSVDQTSGVRSREVAEMLRDDILTGRIPDGLRLTEAELVKRFGVGRGPIREAVQRLSLQGLLETRPNCGAVVAPEAPKPVQALIVPIRVTLETYALREVFDELSTQDFQYWNGVLEEMRIACLNEDLHAIAENDIRFHRYLLVRLHQPCLLAVWDMLVGRIRSHFRKTQRRRCRELMDICDEHHAILETFRVGTLDDAVRLLKDKID